MTLEKARSLQTLQERHASWKEDIQKCRKYEKFQYDGLRLLLNGDEFSFKYQIRKIKGTGKNAFFFMEYRVISEDGDIPEIELLIKSEPIDDLFIYFPRHFTINGKTR